MPLYILKIGTGKTDSVEVSERSEAIVADDPAGAIAIAKDIIMRGTWRPDSNLVSLAEEAAGDSRVVWARPISIFED